MARYIDLTDDQHTIKVAMDGKPFAKVICHRFEDGGNIDVFFWPAESADPSTIVPTFRAIRLYHGQRDFTKTGLPIGALGMAVEFRQAVPNQGQYDILLMQQLQADLEEFGNRNTWAQSSIERFLEWLDDKFKELGDDHE